MYSIQKKRPSVDHLDVEMQLLNYFGCHRGTDMPQQLASGAQNAQQSWMIYFSTKYQMVPSGQACLGNSMVTRFDLIWMQF